MRVLSRSASDECDVQEWQRQERRGIWLNLPVNKAGLLLEPALQQGFAFHHAEKSYIQLTRWLPSTEDKLPANASHQACPHLPCLQSCVSRNIRAWIFSELCAGLSCIMMRHMATVQKAGAQAQ